LIFQCAFYAFTALWALIDIDSFMLVTGPKIDIWLVKVISWLLLAIAIALAAEIGRPTISLSAYLLAVSSALFLGGTDVYYALNGTISPVYLVDAVVEFIVAFAWALRFQILFKPSREVLYDSSRPRDVVSYSPLA
jgi:hypothetical protein